MRCFTALLQQNLRSYFQTNQELTLRINRIHITFIVIIVTRYFLETGRDLETKVKGNQTCFINAYEPNASFLRLRETGNTNHWESYFSFRYPNKLKNFRVIINYRT